jgi:hypothetical protein
MRRTAHQIAATAIGTNSAVEYRRAQRMRFEFSAILDSDIRCHFLPVACGEIFDKGDEDSCDCPRLGQTGACTCLQTQQLGTYMHRKMPLNSAVNFLARRLQFRL